MTNTFISFFIRFGAFEYTKGKLTGGVGELDATGRMLAGLGAGVCEAIVAVTPMETIKVQFINDMRLKQPRFRGFVHGVRLIIKETGIT